MGFPAVSVRVDQRDVVTRAEDALRAADFEQRTGVHVRRCECGATDLNVRGLAFVCAGCGAERNFAPSTCGGVAGRSSEDHARCGRGASSLARGASRPLNFNWPVLGVLVGVPAFWSVAVLVAVWVLR